jgi:hypothetical protein
MIAIGCAVTHPYIRETYNVERTSFKLFFFSGFSSTHPDRTARRTDTPEGSNDAVCCKEAPFGGYIDIARNFGDKITPKPLKFDLQKGLSSQMENVE